MQHSNARRTSVRLSVVAGAVYVLCQQAVFAQVDQTLPTVTVVSSTPLAGVGQTKAEIAAPVQTANSSDILQSGALDLSDYLNSRMGSVHVNNLQGNPYQVDVSYRGYTASPLLGTPQGLSVYVDGVRMNQPFGDVVSWDLIPKNAIASISLMPGSNPLFGLNTLGGALNVQTKDGLSHPGTSVQAGFGSFGRRSLELEQGGSNANGLNWFVAGNWAAEEGWRDDSKSEIRQLFGKFGWKHADTKVGLSASYADNQMNGNGLQEQRFLDRDYQSVYTKPDTTQNRAFSLNLAGSHNLNDSVLFSGNAYYRNIRSKTFNGDINEGSLDQSVYQPSADDSTALQNAGYSGYPSSGANVGNTPFPYWRCIAQALQNDEPGEKCTGLINRTETKQDNYGANGQVTFLHERPGLRNQLVAGAGYDASRIHYQQSTQLGYLNLDRSITGINAFADGVTGGMVDDVPFDNRVNLKGHVRTWSLFASDTVSIRDTLHLTISGRYNNTQVTNRDQLHPGGASNSLDGDHRFNRFNPAVGLTYNPLKALNMYAGYNEGSRAPTAVELGCANPEQPCKLPNAMAGDPPLKQVVTRTWEAGLRGVLPGNVYWHAGAFRADNHDDILFVADNQAGYGYFKNFGKTRRQGLELSLSTRQPKWGVGVHYTLLEATYQSAETVNGSSNSTNDGGKPGVDGHIQIRPGNTIPLMPRHMLKLFADVAVTPQVRIGANLVAVSSSYARGNENNAHQPDGQYYLGSGKSAGYAVFNLNASVKPAPQWEIIGQVHNLFDKKYATGAQLVATAFNSNGAVATRPFGNVGGDYPLQHATFYAPGAPRSFWLGLRYAYDAPKSAQTVK